MIRHRSASVARRARIQMALLVALVARNAPAADAKPLPRHDGVRGHFAFAGLTAEPFGPGSHAVERWGYGVGFSLGVGYGRIPVTLGFDFFGVAWGTRTTRDFLLLDSGEFDAQITRRDRTVFYDAWLRLEPPFSTVRPYVEGIFGVKGLYTEASVRLTDGTGETRVTTYEQPASTLGFGAGIDVKFAENAAGAVAYASLGLRRLHGGRAAFTGVFDGGGAGRFAVSTDTTLVLLGVTVRWEP